MNNIVYSLTVNHGMTEMDVFRAAKIPINTRNVEGLISLSEYSGIDKIKLIKAFEATTYLYTLEMEKQSQLTDGVSLIKELRRQLQASGMAC